MGTISIRIACACGAVVYGETAAEARRLIQEHRVSSGCPTPDPQQNKLKRLT